MVAVFVHGVPESADLWDDLRSQLARDDHIAVALPGFRSPLPDRFEPTMESYASWLAAGIEGVAASQGPVDLVGHDWGGLLTLRVATLRPDLLRSWATDAASLFDPDAVWHDTAQTWQTPGAGEDLMASMESAPPEDVIALMVGLGVPAGRAGRCVLGDPVMDRCVLRLYRSATDIMHTWGSEVERASAVPGLVIVPTDDRFLQRAAAERTAARSGARVEVLEGLGHWWALQDPEHSARALEAFWQGVPS